MNRAPWRAPLITFAAAVTVAITALGWYLVHRAQHADARNELLRRDLCALLAQPISDVPREITKARVDWARPGHPGECQPAKGVVPKPIPVRVIINGHPATIIVNPPAEPQPAPLPSPTPSRSRHHGHNRKPSPAHHHGHHRPPSPTPSPSPTCLILGHICR
jgi:hypothetical protein